MNFRLVSMAVICLVSASANVASAQIIPNVMMGAVDDAHSKQDFVRCAAGRLPGLANMELPLDQLAQAAVERYWATVSSSDSVDVSAAFDPSSSSVWISNGQKIQVNLQTVEDPFARTKGNILAAKPLEPIRLLNYQKARGIWEVTNSSGTRVGYYLIEFTRNSNWSPIRMELLPPDAPSAAIMPYCYKPGDIEAYSNAERAISDSQVAKLVQRAAVVATCSQGPDCSEMWKRSQRWVEEHRLFLLVKNTETLLLTAKPVKADVSPTLMVALDPPTPDGKRTIRFRAWCGNWIVCVPSAAKVEQDFVASLQQNSNENAQAGT